MTAETRERPLLCPACKEGRHTNPNKESQICQCNTRFCACYGFQVLSGLKVDRHGK